MRFMLLNKALRRQMLSVLSSLARLMMAQHIGVATGMLYSYAQTIASLKYR